MQTLNLNIARRHAVKGIETGVLRLKWLAAATRFEIALRRHGLALKYGYDPEQPRVPKGEDGAGEWTLDDENPGEERIRLAGDIPTGGLPEIPKDRPPTPKLERKVIRELARRFGPYIWTAFEAGSWIYDHKDEISAYFDPPKTFDELQEDAKNPQKGYDIHHVVERNSAAKDGSEDGRVEASENKVRVPRWKHWQINGWYETENDDYGGLAPREYLKGKSWEERTRVGKDVLKKFGVLKP